MNTFGSRGAAVILRNVNCNSSHTELSQCVSPKEIYAIPDGRTSCGDTRAGVKCVNSSNSVTTTRPATNGGGSSSAVSGAVIGAVIGVLVAVIIVIIVIVVIVVVVVVVTKRREKSKEPLGQEKTGKNESAHLKECVYLVLSI